MPEKKTNTEIILEAVTAEIRGRQKELDEPGLRQMSVTAKIGRYGTVYRTVFSKLSETERD